MSELSVLSQTILDYATSKAKRTWSESVTDLHLLAAIRHWKSEWFDGLFPDQATRIDQLLHKHRGDSIKPGSVDESVVEHLRAVSGENDLAELAEKLLQKFGTELVDGDSQTVSGTAPVQSRTSKGEDKSVSTTTFESKSEVTKLALGRELVARIVEVTGLEKDSVEFTVASDARVVAARVLGRDEGSVVDVIVEQIGVSGTLAQDLALSDLIVRIGSVGGQVSSRVATQYALSLVDIGEFAASLDDEITEEEIDRIDDVRLECRRLLGERIDATSDAIVEFERKFGELVGMESVKKDLRKRVDFLMVNKRRAQRGYDVGAQRMHMAFVGNPGTGKTTVARLFGNLLRNLDLLPSDSFVEKDRSGLVGTYVGHTEEKTKLAVQSANGGVLFIDEAYALNDRYGLGQKGFGEEAIDVLVKEMEDKRDSLVVIFAGYRTPMEDFLKVNQGLRSRIPTTIEFPDYTTEELLQIADRLADQRGLTMANDARRAFASVLERLRTKDGFGNAREVENLMDAAQRNLTMRVSHLGNLATERESKELLVDDIPESDEELPNRPIGFARHMYL